MTKPDRLPVVTWVVVADEAIARILERRGDTLHPVEELTDPAAHARGTDLRRDATGRRAGGGASGASAGGHGSGQRAEGTSTDSAADSERHQQADDFARRVAGHLATALQQRRFTTLHVVAAPRFLGKLRQHHAPQVAAAIERELDRDLIHFGEREIGERLFGDGTAPRG